MTAPTNPCQHNTCLLLVDTRVVCQTCGRVGISTRAFWPGVTLDLLWEKA